MGALTLTDRQKLAALEKRRDVLVVDLDDTCVKGAWPELGEWFDGAKEALRQILDAGIDIELHTLRLHSMEVNFKAKRDTREWLAEANRVRQLLDEAGLEDVKLILDDKPAGRWYVDDKAIEFDPAHPAKSWRRVVRKVLS